MGETAEDLVRRYYVCRVPTHLGEPCDGRTGIPEASIRKMRDAGLIVWRAAFRASGWMLTDAGRAIRDAESRRLGWTPLPTLRR